MQMADRLAERAGHDGRLSAAQAARIGLDQIAELTGKEPEGVTGVEPGEDGWIVTVEVVEDPRIPSSADILATYETEFDMSGELLSYRRVRRYSRGRGDSCGGSLWRQATWCDPARGRPRSTDRG
jgi:hypothetical protein